MSPIHEECDPSSLASFERRLIFNTQKINSTWTYDNRTDSLTFIQFISFREYKPNILLSSNFWSYSDGCLDIYYFLTKIFMYREVSESVLSPFCHYTVQSSSAKVSKKKNPHVTHTISVDMIFG